MSNRCVHCDFSENAHDHEGHWCKEFISQDRMKACIEACEDIPTDQLGEVKKAWLAWKIWYGFGYCFTPEFSHSTCIGLSCGEADEGLDYVDEGLIIKAAIRLRSRGADFGELNALIDSAKE